MEIFVNPPVVSRGYMELPDKPGYGMELAKDLEKRFPWVPGRFTKPNPDLAA
jgi:L-alanine-DL-glutamate epimerase-like enolase superfamily enzyme